MAIGKEAFLSSYTKVLVAAWTDDEFAGRLDADPVAAVSEYGLEVPEGAELLLTRSIPADAGEPSEEAAYGKWVAGDVSGRYVLSVPETPAVDASELTESDLAAISAGWHVGCCSCPCSCCA